MGLSEATAVDQCRDLNSANAVGWQQRSFPITDHERTKVPVVIKRSALDAIYAHGRSRTDVEICGVLVGDGYRDHAGPFVYVEATIAGEHAGSQLAQVTFTAETWAHIQGEMDRLYPERRIIGWYHTHPGFGIFLSAMDLFIHENFFSSPEQLAFVFDPLAGSKGLFVWRAGLAVESSFLVEEDGPDVRVLSPAAAAPLPLATTAGESTARERDRARSVRAWRGRRLWFCLAAVLITFAAVATAWWMGYVPLQFNEANQNRVPSAESALPEPRDQRTNHTP